MKNDNRIDGMNDDVTFFMQGWEPEGRQPRAVVCLVHGLGEHTGRYAHVGRALNEAGFALYGFDMRGHGRTGGARGNIPSLEAAMQDIQQFVNFQKQSHPGLPLFLYGHSLGGLLSLAYAIQHPEGLRGVIVTAPGLRSPLLDQKMKVTMARMLGAVLPGMIIPTGLNAADISRDPAVVERYNRDPLVHEKTSLGLGRAGITAIDLCFTRAKEFKPPLLIMHGTADRLTYSTGSEAFATLVSETNTDVTFKLWEGLYHEVHNEPEQAEVFNMMVGWIDQHL